LPGSFRAPSAALGISPTGSNARNPAQLRRTLIPQERDSRLLRRTAGEISVLRCRGVTRTFPNVYAAFLLVLQKYEFFAADFRIGLKIWHT